MRKFLALLALLLLAGVTRPQEAKPAKAKHATPPPIHSTKGVIASPYSPDHWKFPRGLKKTPRYKLASAPRFFMQKAGPPQVLMLPPTLSMLGNDQYGDCVTASESFAIESFSVYCGMPEIVVSDQAAIAWAQAGGYLNGADLPTVMSDRQKRGIPGTDGKLYLAGPYTAVDYSNEPQLQAAIAVGPVNVGMDANALPSGAGNGQAWYAFGGSPGEFSNEDHCCRLCGYGATSSLFASLNKAYGTNVPVPSGAPANGYLFYTWSTIGVVDHAWIMSTVGEAWSQNPTVVGISPGPPPPPPPPPPGPNVLNLPATITINADGTWTMGSSALTPDEKAQLQSILNKILQKPAAKPPEKKMSSLWPSYDQALAAAQAKRTPIVLFVGQEARPIAGAAVCKEDFCIAAAKPSVVVRVWAGGGSRRYDLAATASDAEIGRYVALSQ